MARGGGRHFNVANVVDKDDEVTATEIFYYFALPMRPLAAYRIFERVNVIEFLSWMMIMTIMVSLYRVNLALSGVVRPVFRSG